MYKIAPFVYVACIGGLMPRRRQDGYRGQVDFEQDPPAFPSPGSQMYKAFSAGSRTDEACLGRSTDCKVDEACRRDGPQGSRIYAAHVVPCAEIFTTRPTCVYEVRSVLW